MYKQLFSVNILLRNVQVLFPERQSLEIQESVQTREIARVPEKSCKESDEKNQPCQLLIKYHSELPAISWERQTVLLPRLQTFDELHSRSRGLQSSAMVTLRHSLLLWLLLGSYPFFRVHFHTQNSFSLQLLFGFVLLFDFSLVLRAWSDPEKFSSSKQK